MIDSIHAALDFWFQRDPVRACVTYPHNAGAIVTWCSFTTAIDELVVERLDMPSHNGGDHTALSI